MWVVKCVLSGAVIAGSAAQLIGAWGASAVDEGDDEDVLAPQLVDHASAVHGHLAHVGVVQFRDGATDAGCGG